MNIKKLKYSLLSLVLLATIASGCGSKETEAGAMAATSITPPTPEAVSIGEPGAQQVAPPPSPGSVVQAAAPSAAIDLTQAERPVNAQGQPMTDLEFLNHLVDEVNESRISDIAIPQKAFKTEAEQMAYEEAMQQRKSPVKDLNELVTAGVIKALPTAPAGQHYGIDPNTGKVILQ